MWHLYVLAGVGRGGSISGDLGPILGLGDARWRWERRQASSPEAEPEPHSRVSHSGPVRTHRVLLGAR